MKKFSCCIITETSLGAECADVLLKNGHIILGIVSTNGVVSDWAMRHRIPLVSSLKSLRFHNFKGKLDYIFSIVNNTLLSDAILNLPNFCSISASFFCKEGSDLISLRRFNF